MAMPVNAAFFIIGVFIVLLLASMVVVSWFKQRRALENMRTVETMRGDRRA
jgi:hypothetical protein